MVWAGAGIYLHYNPYYAISPGDAISVSRLISVPQTKQHPIRGKILLTDVLLGQVSASQLPADLTNKYVDLLPSSQVLGPSISPSQLQEISDLQMSQSQDEAKIAALSHLGIRTPVTSSGALVVGIIHGLGASPNLKPDDVITAVDGISVSGPDQLEHDISTRKPGTKVVLTVKQGIDGTPRQVAVTLVAGEVSNKAVTLIGVEVYPDPVQTFSLPFPISVNSDQIGGPSAGVAFTLGIINALSTGNITGGKVVAATGTIDAAGNIGPIGGLPQKTVAVRRAGATVFFVPVGESKSDYANAAKFSEGKVKIVRVSTLGQILGYLANSGGNLSGVSINATEHFVGSGSQVGAS